MTERSHAAEQAAMFRALSDEVRLLIFRTIASHSEPVCACDLVDVAGVSQPTVSHHLKQLREAGLLKSRRSGIWSVYEVDARGMARFARLAAAVTGKTQNNG